MPTGIPNPGPPTPADADLNGFPYMPLHVSRLLGSDLVTEATGDEFRAAILLWCAAWHQVPAGSLPTSDAALARLAQYGRDVKGFQKVKKGALRGWSECSDGRLYHPVVSGLVNDAWGKRLKNSNRASNRWGRAKTGGGVPQDIDNKQSQECHGNANAYATAMPAHMPQQCQGNAIEREREREKENIPPKSPKGDDPALPEDEFSLSHVPAPTDARKRTAKSYAFEGFLIRLTHADLERWQKAYGSIDVMAELQSIDDWFRKKPPRGDWFSATSAMLKKKHVQAQSASKADLLTDGGGSREVDLYSF